MAADGSRGAMTPCTQYATYRELRDAMEEAAQRKGRTREQRRRMLNALRDKLADGIDPAEQGLPRGQRPRCGAKTRKGTACVSAARANGRCPNHGGLSTINFLRRPSIPSCQVSATHLS